MAGFEFDLLLTNAHVLTMDADSTHYLPGFVAVKGAHITAVGPMDACPEATGAAQVIDCTDCAILPGLINSHTHLPMVYFRGLADDLPLQTWLSEHIWPAEGKHLSPEFCYHATRLAVAECLKSGVTCVNDMYLFASDVARACADSGIRAFISEGVINVPTPSAANWREGRKLTEALIAEYKHHPLITPAVAAHAPYSCSPELLQLMHALAQEHGLLFQTHLHETEGEPDLIEWGRQDESPTHSLMRIGVLGPKMVAVHCVWVSDHDIAHMQERGCGIATCPGSNMKLGSGIAPLHSMVEGGVNIGVGTDGAASNNNLNLVEEIHLAALSSKAVYKNPEVVPAETALGFATRSAAKLLGAEDRIGQLKAGLEADITVIELGGLHLAPRFKHPQAIYSHLVYSAQGADVRDTIVRGKVLMRDRQLTELDEAELKARAQEWAAKNF
jgi:5-methylthioadenosine/S-adenosylhomocysteine deaminase